MSTATHVRISCVSKSFNTEDASLLALDKVTLNIGTGEFISILGPSGCGKSTLLRIIGGLQEPTNGDVAIDGNTPQVAQMNKELGYVFQNPALMPWRTAKENIRLPLQVNRSNVRESVHIVENLLKVVDMTQFSNYYPSQLSGGMQQRIALARALAFNPTILLMDEPFGALDEITRSAMRYELMRIWDSDKKTVIFVTHSIFEAVTLSDRVVVLSNRPGRVKSIVPIELPRPRNDAIELKPQFAEYAATLRNLLRKNS